MHQWRMTLRHSAASVLSSLVLLVFVAPSFAQAPAAQDGPLAPNTDTTRVHLVSNDDIIHMAKVGLSDDIIVQTIQTKPGHYDTTPDDLIALKTAGISDRVISVMEAHGTGLAQHTVTTDTTIPSGSLPPGVDEIGVYYKATKGEQAGQWVSLQTERVVFRSSGTLKSVLSQGVLGKDTNGYIEGGKSPLVLPTGTQLLLYTPPGTSADEYFFLRLEDHKDHREFRTLTGGLLHETAGPGRNELVFTPKKIGPRLYTYTIPIDIEKGEYGVLPPGSANTQGIAGNSKIFSFSIPE
jgi:hypothetical protein